MEKYRINRMERTNVGTYVSSCVADDIPTFQNATVQLMKDCRDDEKIHLGGGNWVTKIMGAYVIQAPGHTTLVYEEIEMYNGRD
ncbi:MAG: hypothetical protein J6U54_13410 [Clostridiales bacterium]|nr:hypothetical protein [Clostridiales bacterium]